MTRLVEGRKGVRQWRLLRKNELHGKEQVRRTCPDMEGAFDQVTHNQKEKREGRDTVETIKARGAGRDMRMISGEELIGY